MTSVRARRKPKAGAALATNRYDAAGSGRRIARWNPVTTGPQKALAGFEKLRNRVHDAVRNDWAAESSTQKWVTNLIGTGIQPRFKSKAHRAIWDKFGKQADADGVLDVYGLQALMGRGLFDGGEVFLRKRPRALTAPLDIPLQVQVIESEFCPMLDATSWPGLPAGHRINQGIERNKYGQRTAYWFYKEHPHDGAISPTSDQLVRVAASQVSHIYEVKRAGQLRGVSPLANILIRLRNAGDLEDAVLDRQKLANLFAMFITRPMPDPDDVDFNPLTGLPNFYDTDGAQMAGLEPGIAHELRPGEDVKFASPPGAGVGYAEFLRTNHLGTAAGQGMPYEIMSGDIKDVSDRTLRVVINEFRRFCQQRQWLTLIPMGCQRMVDWCMDAAALAGLLPLSQLDDAKSPTHVPQGWEYIHPVQDAQGKKILLDMGVTSKTQIITERGDEPEVVFADRAADAKAEEKAGITLNADGTLLKNTPKPAVPAPAGPPPKAEFVPVNLASAPGPTAAETALASLMTVVAAMQAQNAAVSEAITALAQQLAARPLNVNVEPTQVSVTAPAVNVAAPTVNVEGAVVHNHVEPTPVNVAAPTVNVTNEVQPADVVVDVNLPTRETTSVIGRDLAGNITSVTQTEQTVQ